MNEGIHSVGMFIKVGQTEAAELASIVEIE